MRVCLVDPGVFGMAQSTRNPVHIPLHYLTKGLVELGHKTVEVFCAQVSNRETQPYRVFEVNPKLSPLRS